MNEPISCEASGRVVPFRPRGLRATSSWPSVNARRAAQIAPEPTDSDDDHDRESYRHRMLVNALALLFTVGLAITGVWLADSIAAMQKIQDCALTGRNNCFPIVEPVGAR